MAVFKKGGAKKSATGGKPSAGKYYAS